MKWFFIISCIILAGALAFSEIVDYTKGKRAGSQGIQRQQTTGMQAPPPNIGTLR